MKNTKSDLSEIMDAYGCGDFVYDGSMLVEPDTELFFYHDKNATKYVLLVTDYIGTYEDIVFPYVLSFDYYADKTIDIAVKNRILPKNTTDRATMLDNSILFERL